MWIEGNKDNDKDFIIVGSVFEQQEPVLFFFPLKLSRR